MSYSALAHMYERLNAQAPYEKWVAYLDAAIRRFSAQPPELVLDLACGTGVITRGLAELGYDMIGVDASAEMLSEATSRQSERPILYLQQKMQSFELYGTVGAVVCCLDSLNYLLTNRELEQCFSLVHNYLDPDGLFLFDMNTPYQFEQIYADHDFILESPESPEENELFCGWRNHYDPKTKLCDFSLTFFEGRDGVYRKTGEEQTERCFTWPEIRDALEHAGFEKLAVYASLDGQSWDEKTDIPRWFVVARCKK